MLKRWKAEGAKRTLALSKETLRQLGDTELQIAIGGARGHIPAGGVDTAANCDTSACDTTV